MQGEHHVKTKEQRDAKNACIYQELRDKCVSLSKPSEGTNLTKIKVY